MQGRSCNTCEEMAEAATCTGKAVCTNACAWPQGQAGEAGAGEAHVLCMTEAPAAGSDEALALWAWLRAGLALGLLEAWARSEGAQVRNTGAPATWIYAQMVRWNCFLILNDNIAAIWRPEHHPFATWHLPTACIQLPVVSYCSLRRSLNRSWAGSKDWFMPLENSVEEMLPVGCLSSNDTTCLPGGGGACGCPGRGHAAVGAARAAAGRRPGQGRGRAAAARL